MAGGRTEEDARECDHAGLPWSGCHAVLAGAHGKEEGAADNVGRVGVGIDIGGATTIGEFEELPKEFGGYGPLSLGRGVGVVEGAEE